MLAFVAVGPVVAVDLHTRLGRIDFERAATDGLGQLGGIAQLALFPLVQHEAVVVAGAVLNLLVVGINVLTDGLGRAEVERRTGYLQNLAGRNGCLVGGTEEVGIDLANLILNRRSGIGNARQ